VFLRKVPALGVLRPGSPWVEVDERLGRRPDEPVLVKAHASRSGAPTSASGSPAATRSSSAAPPRRAACARPWSTRCSTGWRRSCPPRRWGDRWADAHRQSLHDMQQKYGDVLPVDDVVAALGTWRAWPHRTPDGRGPERRAPSPRAVFTYNWASAGTIAPDVGRPRSIWRLPWSVSVAGSAGLWRPPRPAGWPSGCCCTWPIRSRAAAAGWRFCVRPRDASRRCAARDVVGAWIAGAGAGASCPRAAGTRCAWCSSAAACPRRVRPVSRGRSSPRAPGSSPSAWCSSRSPCSPVSGPTWGAGDRRAVAGARGAARARAVRRRPPDGPRAARRRRRGRGLRAAARTGRVRPAGAAVAAREPRVPGRRPRVLPPPRSGCPSHRSSCCS
jgi:hypothetical protein